MVGPPKVNHPRATFRLNFQVVQILAIVLVALAVPLALVILGLRTPQPSAPSPEVPGLRAALELAASKSLPPPAGIDGGCRQFVLMPGQGKPTERQKSIERSAAELGGTALLAAQADGGSRLLVQIPAAAASRFEAGALVGFSSSSTTPTPEGDTRLYEILLPPP